MLGRLEAVFDHVDDEIDFVIFGPSDIISPQPRQKGKAALGAAILAVQAEFEHLSYRPHVIIGDGATAAVEIMARLRRRSNGEVIELFITDFVRFREGRLVELREFIDHPEGIEQLLSRRSGMAK